MRPMQHTAPRRQHYMLEVASKTLKGAINLVLCNFSVPIFRVQVRFEPENVPSSNGGDM